MKEVRRTGVLLHITSLPSQYGIGDLGDEAFKFIDTLKKNSITLWQILPTGPTGYGDSPYSAQSAFAGNELFISPKKLYLDGYLSIDEVTKKAPERERVDYGEARSLKFPMLVLAARNFLASKDEKEKKAFKNFKDENSWWLDDYALFKVLSENFNDSRWYSAWPEELRDRKTEAMKKAVKENKERLEIYKVLQYFFFNQWASMKAYANENGVKIVGDIPIFVASDSADAWSNRNLLMIDQEGKQEASSGVPPDAFSSTGQLWGNPLYKWDEHKKTGYEWWIKRIKSCLCLADVVRIDHFRAFEAFWQVPKGEVTAINGKWVKGPGQDFFTVIEKTFGKDLPIIAEDLGVITAEVEKLRDDNDLAGMRIFQFAFAFRKDGSFDTSNSYLPHNYSKLSVAYTGTHDNNTTIGWYNELDDRTRDYVRRYLECSDGEVLWKAIRILLMSHSMWVILPMQDILGLDAKARMNVPSTTGSSNWSWKMRWEDLESSSFDGIRYYSELYGRKADNK